MIHEEQPTGQYTLNTFSSISYSGKCLSYFVPYHIFDSIDNSIIYFPILIIRIIFKIYYNTTLTTKLCMIHPPYSLKHIVTSPILISFTVNSKTISCLSISN